MTHTDECLKAQAERDAARAAYAERWPGHCEECGGWGGRTVSFDPSPSGVGLSSGRMYEFDPCGECVENMRCPRCGVAWAAEDDGPPNACPACGWEHDAPGLPPAHECYCWEEEYYAQQAASEAEWRRLDDAGLTGTEG